MFLACNSGGGGDYNRRRQNGAHPYTIEEESGRLRLPAVVCSNSLPANRVNVGTFCIDWFSRE